ncbi:uncharacterized protein YdeI (YjbR/CyaY-like superfamily) [Staphylococcus lugdunensis]
MDKKQTNAQVEAFLRKDSQWQSAYQYLRTLIFNETELEEQYKWMHPCYTLNNKNVVLIHGFKHYVALLFHKGALLEDQYGTLVQQTEKVQAARQLRFTSLKEIEQRRDEILYYVKQAIQVEQQIMRAVNKLNLKKAYRKRRLNMPFNRLFL